VRPDAIAITGATRTSVFVAQDGRAIGPAVKLDDGRGTAFQQQLQEAYASPSAAGLGAFHPLARALDARRNDPERYRHTRWLLELKDWVNLRLTGRALCDSVAFARIRPENGDMERLLRILELHAGLAAAPLDAAQVIGALTAQGAGEWDSWRGVPMVECGFDAWCASFGMGCVRERSVYNVCGTTEVFGSFDARARAIAGVPCLLWDRGLYHLGGPCLTGLGTLAWFGERFLDDPDPLAVLGCAAGADDDVPLCLPFVSGERMPFWRPDLRASFIGVHSRHGKPELARALVNGLLVFQRWLLRQLADTPEAVYLGGGGAGLPGWAQLKASAFGVPVRIPNCEEPALLGAAMCANVALGNFSSLHTAQQALAPGYRTLVPDAATAQRLQAIEDQLVPHFPQHQRA